MGYSLDEWFSDHGLPALRQAMERIEAHEKKVQDGDYDDTPTSYDIFIGTLRDMLAGDYMMRSNDRFRQEVFFSFFDEGAELKDIIKESFHLACEEGDIVSLTYDSDYDRIKCYYNAALEHEDQLKEKIYKVIEELVSKIKDTGGVQALDG